MHGAIGDACRHWDRDVPNHIMKSKMTDHDSKGHIPIPMQVPMMYCVFASCHIFVTCCLSSNDYDRVCVTRIGLYDVLTRHA